MDQPPTLIYDIIVAILRSALGQLRRQRLTHGLPPHPPRSRVQLGKLLLVMPDLDPLARTILPMLSHAWPVQSAATYGRLDALVHIRDVGLLGTPATPNTARIQAILAAANAAEQLHVLRWLLQHWPAIVQADVWSAQRAIVDACNMSPPERGVEALDFWIHETGLLDDSAAAERRQVVLSDEAVYKSIEFAFQKGNRLVLEWWGRNSHVSKQAKVWSWTWVHGAIRAGQCAIVGLCADLEDAGRIRLCTDASPDGRRTPLSFPILTTDASLESQLVDMACMLSPYPIRARSLVPLLRFWKERQETKGKALMFTSRSVEQAQGPDVLDWLFKESQLRLEYSTSKALKFATSKGMIDMLDWWLSAWKSGLVAELDYDEWVMILATMRHKLDADGNVVSVAKTSRGFTPWNPEVADWWDASGLELKLPGPASAVPSVVDVCAFEPALKWWLARAKRLKAQAAADGHAEIPLINFFPYYTIAGIYRAAYWGSTSVYRWWKHMYDKGIIPPCSPSAPNPTVHQPYSPTRIVELAAMCPDEWAYNFNLRSVLESSSATVSFRGSLVEWARQRVLRPENPLPDYGPNIVFRVCANLGIDPENGGLPAPKDGYVRQGPGEEMVFSW